MHQDQIDFCHRLSVRFPDWFVDRSVLDCGSQDINGNNRFLFSGGSYLGIDLFPGPNVDVVSKIHEFQHEPFDTVISTECLEHDKYIDLSLQRMIDLVKQYGAMILTCATTGRPEHGTEENFPDSSPGTLDYYRNVEPGKIVDFFSKSFKCWSVEIYHHDLYAWGTDKK